MSFKYFKKEVQDFHIIYHQYLFSPCTGQKVIYSVALSLEACMTADAI